jgi:hypothetical protein
MSQAFSMSEAQRRWHWPPGKGGFALSMLQPSLAAATR